MLSNPTKNILLGNIQLIDYCKNQRIDMRKLRNCNIEKMGNVYFFVLSKRCATPSLDNDIDTQPDVVLTMDVSNTDFQFNNTEWTERVL